jgi:hypothetical protein
LAEQVVVAFIYGVGERIWVTASSLPGIRQWEWLAPADTTIDGTSVPGMLQLTLGSP